MTVLFKIEVKGKLVGVAHSREAGLIGWYGKDGKPYLPVDSDVAEMVPHYWRRAFNRAPKQWWASHDGIYHLELRGSRGQYLGRIVAVPYDFEPE